MKNTREKKFKKMRFTPFTKTGTRVRIRTVDGALAQLVAHNTGSVGVSGSNPLCSTYPESLGTKDFRDFLSLFFQVGIYILHVSNTFKPLCDKE